MPLCLNQCLSCIIANTSNVFSIGAIAMKFDTDKYVVSFLLPNPNEISKEEYETLQAALSTRGFGPAQQGKDGYNRPILLLEGTLLRAREQHLEEFSEYESQFLTVHTLYYQDQFIAEHIEHNGESSFRIDMAALESLPQLLASPSASVSRRAFVAEQKERPDYNAPDGSEITYLIKGQPGDFGDFCNCKLPIGKTSTAVKHQTVQELWRFTEGNGEFWLKDGETETVHEVKKGTSILIYPGVSFQFRNMSEDTALESTITTMPPWPGPDEAIKVEGKWTPSVIRTEAAARAASPSDLKCTLFGSSVSTSTEEVVSDSLNAQNPTTGKSTK